ncbi:MAG: M6 family metalloprotease domain-containing protein, partial [Prevotella sp.]|nr:M6 family metalloprotease domain-containing protein [Prevotella sp.]
MKRILLLSVILLCAVAIQAVPAYPGTIQVRQPDGSYLTLRLLGDEWMHFNTTIDGYSVVKDQRGYYVYAELKDSRLQSTARVAHDVSERSLDEQAFLSHVKKYQAPEMSTSIADVKARVEAIGAQRRAQKRAAQYDYSKFKGLIVLVQFNDKEFSRPDYKDIITDMVNMKDYAGYDGYKMPGSVRDYFSDNSDGKFQPKFDVVGPYTVDFSQYDCKLDGGKCDEVLLAALDLVDVDVNYKNYDGDGDGMVDLVFFVVAGNAANFVGNDENLWWPHRSQIWNEKEYDKGGDPYVRKDGVLLWDYASSTELAGYTDQPKSIYIDGIGTICHEFSHVLGLPDFYDSNYEEDGLSVTPDVWSVMDQGCYLNDGYTPAGYSLYERYSVGFTDEPKKITAEGSYTLDPLHLSQTGFRIDSPEKNEFFLLENRQNGQFKWDAYLPGHGLLIHRVDLSNKKVWQENIVNAKPERNYYELIRAGGPEKANTNYDVFPGQGKVTTVHNSTEPANLKIWNGKSTKWGLFNIREDKGEVSFDIQDALTLRALSLPETAEVGVSVPLQLEAQLEPDYAVCSLTWTSSDENIATVDEKGIVIGISEGTCTITVTSDTGQSASCQLTVVEVPILNIEKFRDLAEDEEKRLMFNSAEVIVAGGKTAFIRDRSGSIMLMGMEGLKANDALDGVAMFKAGEKNQLPQAIVTENTILSSLNISGGDAVEPREATLDELTDADLCDYVLVKAAKIVSKKVDGKSGIYLETDDTSIRFFNNLKNLGINKSVTMPKNYLDKYYDVPALYATYVDGDAISYAIYLLDKPTEVEAPTGIVELRLDVHDNRMPVYNLQGQRVSPATKGLLIRGGRKL